MELIKSILDSTKASTIPMGKLNITLIILKNMLTFGCQDHTYSVAII